MAKVLLITGGGRGIGAATARLAAKQGYAACVNYLKDRDAAEALVKEIGGKAIAVAGEGGSKGAVLRVFEGGYAKLGRETGLKSRACPLRAVPASLSRRAER